MKNFPGGFHMVLKAPVDNDDPEGGFAYVSAELSDEPGLVTEMAMPMLDGLQHEIQCLHFWYAIKVKV